MAGRDARARRRRTDGSRGNGAGRLAGRATRAGSGGGSGGARSEGADPSRGPGRRARAGLGLVWLGLLGLAAAWLAFSKLMPEPARTPERVRLARVVAKGEGPARFDPARASLAFPLYVRLEEVAPVFLELLLLSEDQRFFAHFGLDPVSLLRTTSAAAFGRGGGGGSTLTQQLVKNLYLSQERTLLRKLLEVPLSVRLELALGKREILEAYVNHAYLGNDLHGVEAASRVYFGKRSRCLTPMEAAMLVWTLRSPSRMNPRRRTRALRHAAQELLARREEAESRGRLPRWPERVVAVAKPARCAPRSAWPPPRRLYARDAVLREVEERYADRIGDAPFVAYTTIDPELQLYAERAVEEGLRERRRYGFDQIALVAMTPNGAVRALVGGADYERSPWNRALRARRQPGSAFKPLVYLAALEAGMRPDDPVEDAPVSVEGYSPGNIDGRFLGRIPLRVALVRSRNAATVRLAERVGRGRITALARRLGYRGALPDDPTVALGTGETALLDLVELYASFAAGGRPVEARLVEAIRSRRGGFRVASAPGPGGRVVARRPLCELVGALEEVVREGTGERAAFRSDFPVAGKTGTSDDHRDAWFVGFTEHLVAGVWVGRDDARPMRDVTGGDLPARVFRRFMVNAHLGRAASGRLAGCSPEERRARMPE